MRGVRCGADKMPLSLFHPTFQLLYVFYIIYILPLNLE